MGKIVRVMRNGRTYEYDYSVPRIGRKPSEHHLDFRYKEYRKSKVKSKAPLVRCLERDNYTCQMCGFKSKRRADLDVHHKDNNGYGKTNKPNDALANLQTLCHSCHLSLHYDVVEKHKEIKQLRSDGLTLQAIGNQFRISRQRVLQILQNPHQKPSA